MATTEDSMHTDSVRPVEAPAAAPIEKLPTRGGLRFDWIATVLFALLIGGVYLDGWAHNHGKVDTSFFTPWHAVLYSGLTLVGIFLVVNLLLNHRKGYPWLESLPPGYGISLLGGIIFGIGGVLDMVWHILFGIEVSVQALLSPTHLMLALGTVLIVTGALRSAWLRLPEYKNYGWGQLMPAVICIALLVSLFAFLTQYAHPQVSTYSSSEAPSTAPDLPTGLYLMNADGTFQTRLISDGLYHYDPAWSHNGKKMAFAAGPNTGKNSHFQIYVATPDGSHQVRLTNDTFDDWRPAWSPDDSKIVFTSNRSGQYNLYVMNADGSHVTRLTSSSGFGASWSPDGKHIVFDSQRNGLSQIYVMNADGSNVVRLTQTSSDEYAPAWSPDGSKIAFVSAREGNNQVYIMNPDGSHQHALTSGKDNGRPTWSPDSSRIAFVSVQNRTAEVYEMNADGSHKVNVSNNPGADNGSGGLSWSQDGKLLYIVQEHPPVSPFFSQSLGLISILFQAALLMGLVLFLLRRWLLPFGSMTIVFTLSSVAISFMNDKYMFIAAAFVAGLIADVLIWQLKPSQTRPLEFRIFAFAAPVVYYSLYFLVIQLTGSIGWTIHLWMGSIFLAGAISVLLSYLLIPPLTVATEGQ
jgi:Tol biopolymer transport system component